MSHDFAFWDSSEPLEDQDAQRIYTALVRDGKCDDVDPSPKLTKLYEAILSHWPVPEAGSEDEWPFASPPDASNAHIFVSIVPSRLWDVWPVLGKLQKELELVMYDPQQTHVFLPDRLSSKRTRLRARQKRSSNG